MTAPATTTGGSTLSVTTTFTNGSTEPVHQATTTLTVPAGWAKTATTPATFKTVPAGESFSTTWTVHVSAGTTPGPVTLTGTTTYQGSRGLPPATGSATINVAYPTLAAAFNTVGVSDDANPTAGNLDGTGFSYSAQALAAVGITPGGAVPYGSTTFTWPNVPAGQPDTVTTAGQIIAMTGAGSSLSFLATGTNGAQSGPVTVTYTDGSTSTATLTVADWYNNAAVPGGTLIATTAHWNMSAGSTGHNPDQHVSLYAATLPLNSGKQVAYISLPNNPQLHIFATTVG